MLGVIIDDRLSWSEHINAVNGKISKINGILFKLSKYLNSNTLKIIYNSLSYPHLQYGNAVWGNAANRYLNRLTVSQKRAIRTISHVGYLHHTNELFKGLNIIKFQDIYFLESVKFVKKELLKTTSPYFAPRNNPHLMHLRNINQNLVNLPQPRTELARKFITYSGAVNWNSLPLALKLKNNPATFKIHVKKYLINNY